MYKINKSINELYKKTEKQDKRNANKHEEASSTSYPSNESRES